MRSLPLTLAAIALARVALATDSTVIFNEIQYNPVAGQQEFIELRNLNGVDVSVEGWKIEGGVDYTFPAGAIVPGGGYMVIGGVAGAAGIFSGQLDNGGETIRLKNQNGRLMDELTYDDKNGWPEGADGTGATLSRRRASASPDVSEWIASPQIGGTPGTANTLPSAATLVFNEIAAANAPVFFVELRNVSANAVSTSGWTIATTNNQSVAIPAQSVPAGGFVMLDALALGFTPANGAKISLLTTNATILRDTHEVTNRLRGLSPDGVWGFPDSATPGSANVFTLTTDIVINEIYYKAPTPTPPALPSGEQWVELYNKGAAPVDVSLWKFSNGITYQFPAGTPPIPANGYVVVAWNLPTFSTLHPAVTAVGPFSGSLSGSGETITLCDANGNVADEVPYSDSGRWSQWADGGGSSLELRDPRADNSKGEAWDASDESAQAAWVTVASGTYRGLGAATNGDNPSNFNEFVFGLLDEGEFLIDDISVKDITAGSIELIQNGTFESGNAATWRISGTHSGTVVSDGAGKVLKVSATSGTEHMLNHAETTLKSTSQGYHLLDASHIYDISFRAKWLRGGNALNTRLWFNRLPKKTILPRPTTGGTPGAVNGKAVANIGPTFDALAHSPVVPASGQAATVTIKVGDPDGVASVRLFYAANGAAFTNVAMSTSGGGIYSGTVPAQSFGALVQFYVQATDSVGAVSTFPSAGAASRAMIPWQDNRAQLTLPSGAKPHNIRIVIPTADATELYKPENLMSDRAIPGTVILDESEVYYRAGIRLKSSEHGRIAELRCGYTLEFPTDNLFMGLHDTIAIDRSGGTVTGQKEILLRRLINAAGGIYAAEDDICRVISALGGSPPLLLFVPGNLTGPAILSKTRLDSEYLDDQFTNGADGSMHKYERIYVQTQTISPTTRAVATLTFGAGGSVLSALAEDPKYPQSSPGPNGGVAVTSLGADKEAYRWYWLIQNAREADDYTGIMNVTNAVGQAGGTTTFNNLAAQYIDVDEWLRACIPAVLYGVQDNYLGTGAGNHNTLIYFPPGKKALLFPWDMDFLVGSNATTQTASLTSGGNAAKFMANPAWKRLYYGHMLDILNKSFNTAYMTPWATHYTRFSADDILDWVNSFVTPRAQFARDVITGANGQTAPISFVPFTRTSTSPTTVSAAFATVSGVGWINIAEVRLQGSPEPLALTWTGENTWSVQLPLQPGTRIYTLVPYDKYGVQVTNAISGGSPSTATVTVTANGTVFPAGPGSLAVTELNYHPPGATELTEFIELKNVTSGMLNLGGCHFDEELGQGISYTFATGVQLAAGARIIVVRDTAAFTAMYGSGLPVAAGVFTGSFDNGGESIVLYSAGGQEIFRFTYDDSITSTDGNGRTLVRVLSSSNPNVASYPWRESTQINGNPGLADGPAFTGSPMGDADGDGVLALVEYLSGTNDNDPASRPAAPQFFFDGSGNVSVTYPIAPNADDAVWTIETTTTLGSGWVPVTGPVPANGTRFFRLNVSPR